MRVSLILLKLFAILYVKLFGLVEVPSNPCDILFLHTWQGSEQRSLPLARRLSHLGYRIEHFHYISYKDVLFNRYIYRTKRTVPYRYYIDEAYAEYIVARFSPKIIITFCDDWIVSSFLRKAVEKKGGKTINIAHGVTASTHHFTMFDFSYYFIWGDSSVEAALRQKVRYGTTKLIKTGSYVIGEDFSLPINTDNKNILFFSQWLHPEVKEIIKNNINILVEWAKQQNQYTLKIKPHPLDDVELLKKYFQGVDNVYIYPKDVSNKEALEDAFLVIVFWSNAAIEACVLNRPVVVINSSNITDTLHLEDFFPSRSRTVKELNDNIASVMNNYSYYISRGNDFVKKHLQYTVESLPVIISCINSIINNEENFDFIEIRGTKEIY